MADTAVAAITSEGHRARLEKWLPEGSMIVVDDNPDLAALLAECCTAGYGVFVVDEAGLPYPDIAQADILAYPLTQTGGRRMRLVVVPSHRRAPGDEWLASLVSVGIYDIVDTSSPATDLKGELSDMIETPRSFADSARWYDPSAIGPKRGRRKMPRLLKRRRHVDEAAVRDVFDEKPAAEPREAAKAPAALKAAVMERCMSAQTCSRPPAEAPRAAEGGPAADEAGCPAHAEESPCAEGETKDLDESLVSAVADEVERRMALRGAMPKEHEEDGGMDVSLRTPSRAKTVAVGGLTRGAGTTHLAMEASRYIARRYRGSRKVVCRLSDAKDLNAVRGVSGNPPQDSVEVGGVKYALLGDPVPEDADFVVTDCGVPLAAQTATRARSAFSTADLKLMCVSGDILQTVAVKEAAEKVGRDRALGMSWCFRCATEEFARKVFAYMGGASPETFLVPPDSDGWWGEGGGDYGAALHPVLPRPRRRQKPKRQDGRTAAAGEEN